MSVACRLKGFAVPITSGNAAQKGAARMTNHFDLNQQPPQLALHKIQSHFRELLVSLIKAKLARSATGIARI